ncbi:MAG: cobalamin-binding protein, partial [Armatimonadota bacterium]
LDPDDASTLFGRLVHELRRRRLFSHQSGPIVNLYFAGLPDACRIVDREHRGAVVTFCGDETAAETLEKLGIPPSLWPLQMAQEIAYDSARIQFGQELIQSGRHLQVCPPDRSGTPGFGTRTEKVVDRAACSAERGLPPLMRAHVGPYLPDRVAAVRLVIAWARQLAQGGFLDVLSIGTSQLSQSHFGQNWEGLPDGGGVPINSPEEFRAVWEASRPMLVRTYAGTRRIPELARMYEETINIAWHALSFWWFSQIDGRGPNSVLENLRQHLETLRLVADSGKPFEPNIPHHFAFRGADDVTYVVSAVLAAKAAKLCGVRWLVLQTMLNTPKYTWGVQDLAKARAALALVRELEDDTFRVLLQPRAGLDYLSHDPDRAKAQLAAATALMDDIEPHDTSSPAIIHVVSYSEGFRLADPPVVNESIQITLAALQEYRSLRRQGKIDDMSRHPEVLQRTEELISGARAVLKAAEASIPDLYTPEGLYHAFAAGFLPVPYLWLCRDEFPNAVRWQTRLVSGGVHVCDPSGRPIPPEVRAAASAETARSQRLLPG